MEQVEYILVTDFCQHHHLEISFIHSLRERGMVEVGQREEGEFLHMDAMNHLEKLVRLHQDLNIHPDDLDVVADLLDRLDELQEEVDKAKARLRFFEQQFEKL